MHIAKLFDIGAQFPPQDAIPRLAKYKRGRIIYDNKHNEIYDRASEVLKDTPHAAKLKTLLIAVGLMDVLVTKPADLLVAEPPVYESGGPDNSLQQQRLTSIVEENDLNQRIHEAVIGAGFRGDAWVKTRYAVRQDFSEVPDGYTPPNANPEPIIEAVDASYVFPEFSNGSRKRMKAVNIAYVEHVTAGDEEHSFLNVERHVPGFIIYERYRVTDAGVDTSHGVPIEMYSISEKVSTGRDVDVVETGVPMILVHHIPYKTDDERWQGVSGVEKLESILAAINDRLVLIDYVVTKHSDPPMYGPELDSSDGTMTPAGLYIPVANEDHTPGYMTWEAQLEAAFKELSLLIGLVFQLSETPQWVFGTTLAGDTSGGTGTSHTDTGAIKARFFPLLSKVKRIRTHVDRAIRDALYTAMLLENYANEGVDGWEAYEPPYPKIRWKDGIPRDENAEAEYWNTRTGGKPTADVQTAIKSMDGVDDEKAQQILDRIEGDEQRMTGTVDASVFNDPQTGDAA